MANKIYLYIIYVSYMFFMHLQLPGAGESCLNMRHLGKVLKHYLRNMASANAMKETCVFVFLAF